MSNPRRALIFAARLHNSMHLSALTPSLTACGGFYGYGFTTAAVSDSYNEAAEGTYARNGRE
jgi:hypothetical protein